MANIRPSRAIDLLISNLYDEGLTRGMYATEDRMSNFGSPLEATLTGAVLDPSSRQYADEFLTRWWGSINRRTEVLNDGTKGREVIIGSGFHAAVYAATRVQAGFPKPLVFERSERVGGTFAMTATPTFWLNSRNRPGSGGLAGDNGVALNYLPGGIIQAANVGMQEFQPNSDMGIVIRLTLAQYADVIPNARVTDVTNGNLPFLSVDVEGFGNVEAGRVIDARGLGDPNPLGNGGERVLSFAEFMQRMTTDWPLRGLKRVAVIGGGDSGKCAVESLLGIAPQPQMAAAALDHVERIDWYASDLPTRCKVWRKEVRGRYQAIGTSLRRDRFGNRRVNVIEERVIPVGIPNGAVIGGRIYDLVVVCTGNRETLISGQNPFFFGPVRMGGTEVATRHENMESYRVGPHARLPFSGTERESGIAAIPNNAVSMFRTATKTAILAASLPATPEVRVVPEEVEVPF